MKIEIARTLLRRGVLTSIDNRINAHRRIA